MKERLIKRFVKYAKIDTQSKHDMKTYPSTKEQFVLARSLVNELKRIGIKDVSVDKHGYVIAKVKSNIPSDHRAYKNVPAVGLLAHLDTAPDLSGKNVSPRVIENYDGGDIRLGFDNVHGQEIIIKETEDIELQKCQGHTIIVTDGKTLLGADDKAGIAAIITAIENIIGDEKKLHGDIYICFNPDEEIGQGTMFFPNEKFPVKYAYTVDGGAQGILNKETFNADNARIIIKGRDIHPGEAKDVMVNAIRIAGDLISWLPKEMSPEVTAGHTGFIHPTNLTADVSGASIRLIIRDFDEKGLKEKERLLYELIEHARAYYPGSEICLELTESYRNMINKLEECPEVLTNLEEATVRAGIGYRWEPIRGGTDGAQLSMEGIPTPNIFTGGRNFHSRTEWLSVDILMKSTEVIQNIIDILVEKNS